MRDKKYRPFHIVIVLLVASAYAMFMLPVLDAECGSIETGIITIKIYNFCEFGVAGSFVVIAPLLLLILTYAEVSENVRVIAALTVLTADFTSLVYSLKSSYAWLNKICSGSVSIYWPIAVEIIAIAIAAVLIAIPETMMDCLGLDFIEVDEPEDMLPSQTDFKL